MQGSTVVQAPLQLAGQEWLVSCVSMGNPHAVIFGNSSGDLQVLQCKGPLDVAAGLALWLFFICVSHVMHSPSYESSAFTAILVCLHANHASMCEAM